MAPISEALAFAIQQHHAARLPEAELCAQGQLDEAVASFRRAVDFKPDFVEAHSNLLYTLNFCPGCDQASIYAEHRRWEQQHARPLAKFIQPHSNDRSPGRRLRV